MAPLGSARALPLLLTALLATACSARRLGEETPPCQRCHGGDGSAAPPPSVLGYRDTTARPVGAHRAHLEPQGDDVRAPIACAECHVVPTGIAEHPGATGPSATVTFGSLARARGSEPAWDPVTERCSGVYCHGAKSGGGTAKSPRWTLVDGTQRRCDSCHGSPPPSHAGFANASSDCHACHPDTVNEGTAGAPTIDLASGTHIDGAIEATAGACDACHGAPPDTGAHRLHASPASVSTLAYGGLTVLEDVSPAGGPSYEFGCGHCHPLDVADHFSDLGGDGLPDVVLAPPSPPVAGDLLKARNAPAAAWDPATKTCSGVYCHSSGQETPVYATTPRWDAAPGALGCDGCHGNPPAYASGGPGAPDANSHVNLDLETDLDPASPTFGELVPSWEFGHFAGMPGPDHTSKHGGGDPAIWGPGARASPITCQACHFETVDPAHVRAGGFFYFDPGGDYDLRPLGLAGRETSGSWLAMQCATCHAGEGDGGRALPLRHVNGKRDVTFDRRTALPAGYPTGLPALATPDPVRPFYVTTNAFDLGPSLVLAPPDCATDPVPSCGVAADVEVRATAAGSPAVLTLRLEHAQYDPATKSCSAVACHLARQLQVDTGGAVPAAEPLRWGAPYYYLDARTCNGCHPQ